jgi:hypothetical protein
MDDYQRAGIEMDKLTNNFLISPLLVPNNFELGRLRNKIQTFESPMFSFNDFLKTNVGFHDPAGMVVLPKEDDFRLDNPDQVKVEAPSNTIQHHIEHPHLDIHFDMHNNLRPEGHPFAFNQINRSRAPSFHLGRNRFDSEDIYNGGIDLLGLLKAVSKCTESNKE